MAVPSSVAAAAYEEMRKVVWAELDKYPHLKDLLKQFLEMEKARNVNFGGTRARLAEQARVALQLPDMPDRALYQMCYGFSCGSLKVLII